MSRGYTLHSSISFSHQSCYQYVSWVTTASVIFRSAARMSSIVPIVTSMSGLVVSCQVRVLPQSLQNPRITPGDDENVLYASGDMEYGLNPSGVDHLKCNTGRLSPEKTIAPVCFRH